MVYRCAVAAALLLVIHLTAHASPISPGPRIEVSFANSAHSSAITGRLFLMISRTNDPEVRLQLNWSLPAFGMDVDHLEPGRVAIIDRGVLGYPLRSLVDVPAGDYYVQALLNVYTNFHRADGHTIWAHMDQWEGQAFNKSPGNLYSKPQKLHLDGSKPYTLKLSLTEVIPPAPVPADTQWLKHVKIQSALLTRFWGRPIYIGAVILLPRDYDSHPEARFPVIYQQGHFSENVPFRFRTTEQPDEPQQRRLYHELGHETGYEFYQHWNEDHFPRMIAVVLLHPTPYYDDSYAVNSANNGPYGDAIMTELIPYIEAQFRVIRKPYARLLTGGSTGGWESLALQVFHPDFFGGTWSFYPDPVDFRRYQLVDIYNDDNAFDYKPTHDEWAPMFQWVSSERPYLRKGDGQPVISMRDISRFEAVLGTKDRSAEQLAAWEAAYGPVGSDGYPKPLWDKTTGKIDHDVASYMRNQGYDLRAYVQDNWPKLGPKLVGKLHLSCGDMDNHFLNLGVYLMQEALEIQTDPPYGGSFEFGRPMKVHGWQPVTESQLVKLMSEQVSKNPPADATLSWKYDSYTEPERPNSANVVEAR
jgi:Putative esterase